MFIKLLTSFLDCIKTIVGIDNTNKAFKEMAYRDGEYGICCNEITRKLKNVPVKNLKSWLKFHDPAVIYELGCRYIAGEGVSQSIGKGFALVSKAAELGNTDAQYKLGDLHYFGIGIYKNSPEAVHWYRKAANSGNMLAQANLAGAYESGNGVEQDDKQAFQWFMKPRSKVYLQPKSKLECCTKMEMESNKARAKH